MLKKEEAISAVSKTFYRLKTMMAEEDGFERLNMSETEGVVCTPRR